MTNMVANNSVFDNDTYDDLLVNWENQAVRDNVSVNFGTGADPSSAGIAARTDLIDDHNWTFVDADGANP